MSYRSTEVCKEDESQQRSTAKEKEKIDHKMNLEAVKPIDRA